MRFKTLDGRTLVVSVDEIISPKTVRCIQGEGMPILNRNNKDDHIKLDFGNLYVKFEVSFPKSLNEDQRRRIDEIFLRA